MHTYSLHTYIHTYTHTYIHRPTYIHTHVGCTYVHTYINIHTCRPLRILHIYTEDIHYIIQQTIHNIAPSAIKNLYEGNMRKYGNCTGMSENHLLPVSGVCPHGYRSLPTAPLSAWPYHTAVITSKGLGDTGRTDLLDDGLLVFETADTPKGDIVCKGVRHSGNAGVG